MTIQADILEGVARNAYIWKSLLIEGSNSIEPFDKLPYEERKPYYTLAYQIIEYLHSQRVVIKAGRKLPRFGIGENLVAVEPLMEDKGE